MTPQPRFWNEFRGCIRAAIPECPIPLPENNRQNNQPVSRATAARSVLRRETGGTRGIVAQGAVGVLSPAVTDIAGGVLDVVTADSVGQAAYRYGRNYAIWLLTQAGAGTGVGAVVALLEHLYVGLERSEEMAEYLNKIDGFVHLLSHCAFSAYHNCQLPTVAVPPRRLPPNPTNLGQALSRADNEEAFLEGFDAAVEIVNEYNETVSPLRVEFSRSKLCLNYLMEQAWPARCYDTALRDSSWRGQAEGKANDYILREILSTDMSSQRNDLQRWSRQLES